MSRQLTSENPDARKFDEIAGRYYRHDESASDNADRVERAGVESGKWFEATTEPQRDTYQAIISNLAGNYSPRAERIREAARGFFYASTAEARVLCLRAFEDFLRDGEVSEATAEAFDALSAAQQVAEAA